MVENHYNPETHVGVLPVRVLQHNIVHSFEILSSDLFDNMKDEVKFKGLNPGIAYSYDKVPINEIAFISDDRKIHLFENTNAFIWCICYGIFVLYDEAIQKPTLAGKFDGSIDHSNNYITEAIEVVNYGMSLRYRFSMWPLHLPNPEQFDSNHKDYVGKTNSLFLSATTMILTHEFAHQYLGHLDYTPVSKNEFVDNELKADQFAIDFINSKSSSKTYSSLKIGVVICIFALLLLSDTNDGGDSHPDFDVRIKRTLNQLQLDESDHAWGIACFAIRLWCIQNKIEYSFLDPVDSYQKLFYESLQLLRSKK